jgi:hypothetical protein
VTLMHPWKAPRQLFFWFSKIDRSLAPVLIRDLLLVSLLHWDWHSERKRADLLMMYTSTNVSSCEEKIHGLGCCGVDTELNKAKGMEITLADEISFRRR